MALPIDDDDAAEGHALELQEPGHVVAGRYRIRRLIGEGGMAVVYEGEHTEIGKRVAIKIVHATFAADEEIVRRFRREARSASAVESEHIIQVFDAGHDANVGFFLVMELLQGEDLAKVLAREKRLDPVFACGLVRQAAHALEKAHASGIVHRDLKPANVYLHTKDDGSSQLKLVDFGIAKMIREASEAAEHSPKKRGAITRRGVAIGTPQYMSPEQAQGLESVNHRTDVYSLGAVLFEAVTGQAVIEERATYEQTILGLLSAPAPRLKELAPEVPDALDELVASMLEHDVDKRVRDMRTVRERLEAIYPEIRGSSLKLKSVRPPTPSMEEIELQAKLAPTIPGVTYAPRGSTRRRAVMIAIVAAAVGIAGAIAVVAATRTTAKSDVATGGTAPPATATTIATTTPTATTTSAAVSSSAAAGASGPASAGASANASASPRTKTPSHTAAPSTTATASGANAGQVGGTGISSQF